MKVAVFDFCDTVVNFQTADRFVYYAIEHAENKKIKKRKSILDKMQKMSFAKRIDKLTDGKYSLNKRIILWQLRGASKQEMDEWSEAYYREEIVPNLHADILEIIQQYQEKGYFVYLASGGYDIYLRFFISDYRINGCVCTKLKFNKNIFSGKIYGWDCMRRNKTRMLMACFKEHLEHTVVYTDSKTDLSLLIWADEGIVVSKKSSRSWPKEYGFKEHLLFSSISER